MELSLKALICEGMGWGVYANFTDAAYAIHVRALYTSPWSGWRRSSLGCLQERGQKERSCCIRPKESVSMVFLSYRVVYFTLDPKDLAMHGTK